MIAPVRLGLRLAAGTPGQRGRSALVAMAAALGTVALLVTLGMVAAPQLSQWFGASPELFRFRAAVVGGVALPVLALAGTVGRLSASLRDRRLGNLRLLGLTATQTRVVGTVESGVAALAGSLVGTLAFWLVQGLPGSFTLGGLRWRLAELQPTATTYLLAVLAVPLAVTVIAGLPQRLDARRALERARRADARRPSWWRVLPLLAGIALSIRSWGANDDFQLSSTEVAVLFAGVGLIGVGLLLVVPVFVRLLADLMLRLARRPTTMIAARRLQAQPAGVTRVIAALMMGLFLVVGARAVVVAFESTPQYLQAEQQLRQQQWAGVYADPSAMAEQRSLALSVPGVRDVVSTPWLAGQPGKRYRPGRGNGWEVMIGTCADLRSLAPQVSGCVDGEPLWLHPFEDAVPARITLAPISVDGPGKGRGPTLTLSPGSRVASVPDSTGDRWVDLGPVSSGLLLPPTTPGLSPLLESTQRGVTVIADPGRTLVDDLSAAGVQVQSDYGFADYDFVGGLRAIVYALATLVLCLGLFTFGIAAIDRALSRRRELASLQVLGTPPGVLRRAQWLEAAAPCISGTMLAIGAGYFAGMTFLRLDSSSTLAAGRVLPATLTLAVSALLISALVAALTVIAGNTRLTADQIRAE